MSSESEKDGEGFARRWSRRKSAVREGDPIAPEAAPEEALEKAPADLPAESPGEQVNDGRDMPIPEDLPDIDSLDKESDYTLFMRDSTPQYLKRMALRKLWNSDPALAVLDGLNDYDEDYSMIGMVTQEITTRYQVGKGIVDPDEEKEKEKENEDNGDVETSDEIAEDVEDIEDVEDVEDGEDVDAGEVLADEQIHEDEIESGGSA